MTELKAIADQPTTPKHTPQLSIKLGDLDSNFKTLHFEHVDLVDDEGTLEGEQATLDQHDDDVAVLAVQIQQLLAVREAVSVSRDRKVLSRKLRKRRNYY